MAPVAHAVAWLVLSLALAHGTASWAQTDGVEMPVPPRLKGAAQLSETVAPTQASPASRDAGSESDLPTFVFGERITGRPERDTLIDGNAELRRGSTAIRADRIEYWQPTDTLTSRGNVRINQAGNRFEGTELQLAIARFEGFFTSPSYRFLSNGGNGSAERVDFIDKDRFTAYRATYTTCQPGVEASWQAQTAKPAWELQARQVDFDFAEEVGTARGAVLRFKDIPILGIPKFTFPLSDKRKSGFLPPTFGIGSTSGFEYRQPYYVNIAPNQDATITPGILTKRGLDLAGEYRYLMPSYRGELRGNVLPNDRQAQGRTRWSYALQHSGSLDSGIAAIGPLDLNLNLNRVSDNNYWRDFAVVSTGLPTQRLLAHEASLAWNRGFFTSSLRYLKWQTLQDPLSPIVPPYNRLPQLNARYSRVNTPLQLLPGSQGFGSGFDASVEGDTTWFSADRQLTGQPNGQRAFARLQLSRPWIAPAAYITPKVQLHATRYRFDTPLANGALSASRVVPTFSLDSGLQFEREAAFLGRNMTQTLEPRAFYVRTPYRDQQLLPNYDSAANDFNFATVFTENAFVGNDRFSEANLLTLGLTSRLLDPATGAENLRFGVAQRLRFGDQRVTLPGQLPATDRISDFLAGSTINWTPQWNFDGTVQYNPKTRRSERASLGVRYSPGNYRTVSASFREQRGTSRTLDIGWQWPINDLWGDKGQDLGAGQGQGPGRYYSVGRLNYSLLDKKFVDAVLGVEYDGCCWIGRVVLQRSQNNTTASIGSTTFGATAGGGSGGGSSNTRILFQLELVGFSRLGSNPLAALQSNVPRYQVLREKINAPSRFTTYD